MAYLATLAEKKAKLAELEEVYDRALAGEIEISISDPSGGSVTYRNPDRTGLEKRIADLKAQIAQAEGGAPPRGRIPIGFR